MSDEPQPSPLVEPTAQRLIDELAMAGDVAAALRLQRMADRLERRGMLLGFIVGATIASLFWAVAL